MKSDTAVDSLIVVDIESNTIDTFELPGAAGVVELGAVEHVPHTVGVLVVLAAVSLVQTLHKLVLFPNLGAGKDITPLTVGLASLEWLF